jgi:hypothetical protein
LHNQDDSERVQRRLVDHCVNGRAAASSSANGGLGSGGCHTFI